MIQCQSLIKAKDQLIEQLKRELTETTENLQTIVRFRTKQNERKRFFLL